MAVTKNKISDNIKRIMDNVAGSCAKAGRDENSVKLVTVTKSVDVDTIKNCIELGLRDFGENRVQQLESRYDEINQWLERKRIAIEGKINWHMIGHLQRNKVKAALHCSNYIHSVDSLRLAEDVNHKAEQAGVVAKIMLQVNCSEEEQKYGCAVGAAPHLTETFSQMPNIELVGLMTMAEFSLDPEQARPAFSRLREIFEDMKRDNVGGKNLVHLSMGMSGDYQVAVEEGATIIRVGSAVFS